LGGRKLEGLPFHVV